MRERHETQLADVVRGHTNIMARKAHTHSGRHAHTVALGTRTCAVDDKGPMAGVLAGEAEVGKADGVTGNVDAPVGTRGTTGRAAAEVMDTV